MKNTGIRKFNEALDNKHRTLSSLAKSGKKIIGYFCNYTPLEIIHAAGCIPTRVFNDSKTLSKIDMHIPNFTCPYLRGALESGLNGTFDYLSGVVQGYTCDVTCGLINVWKENIGGEIFHIVPLPYNDNPDSRRYLRSALEELGEKLQHISGQKIDSTIESSVAVYESIGKQIMALYEKRYGRQLPFSGRDFYTVIQAGWCMPPEQYLLALEELMRNTENVNTIPDKGTPVIVSGSMIEELEYFDIIEASGGTIVGDDLCAGYRQCAVAETKYHDPIERVIDRHFKRFPCPARSRAVERADLIKGLIRASHATGVIFLIQKFCTPHLADYPVIKEILTQEGVPSIMLEMNEAGEIHGQLYTRLEGFFEVMKKR